MKDPGTPVFLAEDRLLSHLHEDGLEAARLENYHLAHLKFDDVRKYAIKYRLVSTDEHVQYGRVMRDDGLTYMKEALASQTPFLLYLAARRLQDSLAATGSSVSGEIEMKFANAGPHETPKRPRRELLAEHGMTLSTLGRVGTVALVVKYEPPEPIGTTTNYGLAHDILKIGGNGYYRTSNAMDAARQERISRRHPHTMVWIGRAAYGLAWTAVRDRRNFIAATTMFGSRARSLRSLAATRESVLAQP